MKVHNGSKYIIYRIFDYLKGLDYQCHFTDKNILLLKVLVAISHNTFGLRLIEKDSLLHVKCESRKAQNLSAVEFFSEVSAVCISEVRKIFKVFLDI